MNETGEAPLVLLVVGDEDPFCGEDDVCSGGAFVSPGDDFDFLTPARSLEARASLRPTILQMHDMLLSYLRCNRLSLISNMYYAMAQLNMMWVSMSLLQQKIACTDPCSGGLLCFVLLAAIGSDPRAFLFR